MNLVARAGPADGAVDALDGARRWLWRQVVRTRTGRACARDRSTRVVALGLGHVAIALILAGFAPAYLLVYGPLVLGVPHVVADLRYLVVRGPASLRSEAIVALAAPLAALAGSRAVELLGGPGIPLVDVALGFAAIAIAVALAPRAHPAGARRWWIAAGVVAIAIPALADPDAAVVVLLHGHNLVGIVIWVVWTRRTVRLGHRLAIVTATAAVVVAVLAGALDGAWSATVAEFATALAPGLAPELAYRVALAYAFLQAVHYVVWLRLIPSTQARVPAASTFRRSLGSLRDDFGLLGLAAIAATALAVPALACALDPARVRDGYLALAVFHGWLELAIVAYVLVSRERLGERNQEPFESLRVPSLRGGDPGKPTG